MNITARTLQTEYERVGREWLERYGLHRFNQIVYKHKHRRTYLIGAQRPEKRYENDHRNHLMFLLGVEAWYRLEQQGKDIPEDVPSSLPRQVRIILIHESYDRWATNYPTQNQILGNGKAETLEVVWARVQAIHDNLRLVSRDDSNPIFLMDENFQPIENIGFDPDMEPPSPRRGRRNHVELEPEEEEEQPTPRRYRVTPETPLNNRENGEETTLNNRRTRLRDETRTTLNNLGGGAGPNGEVSAILRITLEQQGEPEVTVSIRDPKPEQILQALSKLGF